VACGMDWRSAAACRNRDPDLFFPVSLSGLAAERQLAEAKDVCAHCPVRAECLEFALRTRQAHGVWGGLSEQERRICGGSMYDQLIQAQATAAQFACKRIGPLGLKALHENVEEACQLPADAEWVQKGAAHAAFFRVLAEVADDPVIAPVLVSGSELAFDLMMMAGRAAHGIVINSRRRFLECLDAGDPEGAARALEEHLRILHFMCRMAGRLRRERRREAR
jgi:WhiB family transcriptional regulator, redox-sensing transcriptional regulator